MAPHRDSSLLSCFHIQHQSLHIMPPRRLPWHMESAQQQMSPHTTRSVHSAPPLVPTVSCFVSPVVLFALPCSFSRHCPDRCPLPPAHTEQCTCIFPPTKSHAPVPVARPLSGSLPCTLHGAWPSRPTVHFFKHKPRPSQLRAAARPHHCCCPHFQRPPILCVACSHAKPTLPLL